MAKKLAGVDAQMIGGPPEPASEPSPQAAPTRSSKPAVQYGVNLNFRVSPEFRRSFRKYAANHDLKLNEVLMKAFEALMQSTPASSPRRE